MTIRAIMSCKVTINFYKPQAQTGLKKIEKSQKEPQSIATFWAKKTQKVTFLALNYGLSSSFTTSSRWRTTKFR